MSINVKAEEFISYFKIALEEEIKGKILDGLYSCNCKWTTSMESIYKRIGNLLNEKSTDIYLHSKNTIYFIDDKIIERNEYAKIDATYWLEDESINLSGSELSEIGMKLVNKKVWNMLLAVEHENDSGSNLHEVKQLLLVNTPLRVLISYSDFIDGDEVDGQENRFNKFSEDYFKIFKKLEDKSKMTDGEEFVFLFGNRTGHIDYLKQIKYQGFIVTKKNGSLISSRVNDIVVEP